MSPYEFDFADRVRKALRISGMRAQDVAATMEVSRNTISAWAGGRSTPMRQRDLREFAEITGVDLVWLQTGERPRQLV